MTNLDPTSSPQDHSLPPLHKSIPQVGSLSQQIERVITFINTCDRESLTKLLVDTTTNADEFADQFRVTPAYNPSAELAQKLNNWFTSPQGVTASAQMTDAIIEVITRTASLGHPGHDRRHILLKDPLSALRHCVEDSIFDYRSIYLLGALMHDFGRLPEPRLYGKPAYGIAGKDHQYLGYALLKHILDACPAVPSEITDSILFSVLVHQSGADRDCFAAQFVQRADREQLVGPEFILRAIGSKVGDGSLDFWIPNDTTFSLPEPGTAAQSHVVTHIESYARNLYPNIGSKAAEHTTVLKGISMQFLALAYGISKSNILFGPEIRAPVSTNHLYEGAKYKLHSDVISWIRSPENGALLKASTSQRSECACLSGVAAKLHTLLSPKLAADPALHHANALDSSSPKYSENLLSALMDCSQEQLRNWDDAFNYAIAAREHIDSGDAKIISDALAIFAEQSVGGKLARMIEAQNLS